MECLLPYLCMVTVPHIMVVLERMLDYRGVGLVRFHCSLMIMAACGIAPTPHSVLWKTCSHTFLQQLQYTHTRFLPRSTGIENTAVLIQALVSIVLNHVSHVTGYVWFNTHRIPLNTACIPSARVCMYIRTYVPTCTYVYMCVYVYTHHNIACMCVNIHLRMQITECLVCTYVLYARTCVCPIIWMCLH